jgi:ribulose-5-phosphate 4-epimerase/fuculose-1-phosphate aldolase
MKFMKLREQVYRTTMDLCEVGLIRLSAGNISARHQDSHIAITPSGMLYSIMRPRDIVIVDPNGQVIDGDMKPSSETPMHAALYSRLPNVGAVIHTHSLYAMVFAITGVEIPVTCLEILAVGGPVPVAPYACPGSKEAGLIAAECFLSHPVLKALMLRNHGLIALGENLEKAFQVSFNCEIGAQVYHNALQIDRLPVSLTGEQIDEINQTYQKRH